MLNPFKASSSLDEVVFANRNKAYGAYAIRKQYDTNMVKSVSVVAAGFILLLLTGFISKPLPASKTDGNSDLVKPIEVELITFSLPPSAPPALPQAPAALSHENQNYRVQADRQVAAEVIPVTNPATPATGSTQGSGTGTQGGVIGGVHVEGILNTETTPNKEPIFFTEVMPLFNNGEGDIVSYLAKEIDYPQRAVTAAVSGKVVVRFDVAADGSVTNIIVEKGIGFGCDEEAVRVVSAMPRWKPGMQNGKAVPVRMRLPIKFEMQ